MARSNVETEGRAARRQVLDGLPVDERRLDVRGVATSVLQGGKGEPVVLLHGGIPAGGLVWWRVLPSLAESHRLVVPDLPGLGESEIAEGGLDAGLVGGWLEELIRATCAEPPVLVAHSAPGALATRFAVERGDRLRGLVLVDPGGIHRAGLPPPRVLLAVLRSTARPSDRAFHGFMRRVMLDVDRVRQEDERWPAFVRYVLARAALPTVKRTMRQVGKAGLRGAIPEPELARIDVPVALIWGRHDRLTPLGIGEGLGGALGWPLHVVEDAGHLPHVEQPRAFTDALGAAMGTG